MSQKILIAIIIVVILLGGGLYWLGQKQPQKYTGPVEKITLATIPEEISALIWIAQDQGYFADNGLDVTIKEYDTGIGTVKALFAGEVDIATTVEFVVVNLSFDRDDITILGSISQSDINNVVARKDRGIAQPSDLKGKKIGLKFGSSSQFWIARLLTFNNISLDEVELVDVHPPNMSDAISNGEVDAVVTWQPHALNAEKALGKNAVSWSVQSGQDLYWVLMSLRELTQTRPVAIERLMKAFVQAEQFVKKNEGVAKGIIARNRGIEISYLDIMWPKYNFALNLPQELLLAMEDEARWNIANKRTDKTEVPNYLNVIYLDGLEAAKPGAVTIIR